MAKPSSNHKEKEVKEVKDSEAIILDYTKDKYRLVKSAVRWACEIKQKENLPEPVSLLIPRALEEIMAGQVSVETIEKLPDLPRSAMVQPQSVSPSNSSKAEKNSQSS